MLQSPTWVTGTRRCTVRDYLAQETAELAIWAHLSISFEIIVPVYWNHSSTYIVSNDVRWIRDETLEELSNSAGLKVNGIERNEWTNKRMTDQSYQLLFENKCDTKKSIIGNSFDWYTTQ